MLKILFQAFSIFGSRNKLRLLILQIVIIFSAFSEVMGIASIGPFMAIVSDPSLINENEFYSWLYASFRANSDIEFITYLGTTVVLILFSAASIATFSLRFIYFSAQKIGANLSSDLFEQYMRSNWIFHTQRNSSQLIANINSECNRITIGIVMPLLILNSKLFIAVSIIAFLYWVDPLITIFGFLFFGIIYVAIFFLIKQTLSSNSKLITESQNIKFKAMNEGFGGIKELILLNRTSLFINNFRKYALIYAKSYGTYASLTEIPKYWIELIAFGGMVLLIVFLMSNYEQSFLDLVPTLATFAMASYRLIPAFQQIYINVSHMQFTEFAINNISNDLNQKTFLINQDDKQDIYFNDLTINLADINFKYPNTNINALNDINLEIPPNIMLGFVGPSGSGKSTLIDLIMGLLKPNSGKLSVGGEIINSDLKAQKLQQHIGYVPQAIFLSDESIRNNIAFGIKDSEIDDDKVERAMHLAQLTEFISTLKKGINTLVGEKGVQLSGGQRQRIAIARALYNQPSILILDEATSSLDGSTEEKIMNSVNEISKFMTILIVAHRINTVKDCSRIFYLEQGKIVDSGSYQDLISSNAKFRKLTTIS